MLHIKQSVQLLLIALFLFTYQTTAIHSKHHHIEEASACHLCKALEYFDLHHQESPLPVVNEYLAIELNEMEEKKITQTAHHLLQKSHITEIDFHGLLTGNVVKQSLGYFSTAPPSIFCKNVNDFLNDMLLRV